MDLSGGPYTTVMATRGMVSSPHYLVSQVALSVLKQGGNAIEAAIAGASTLAVVYPHMSAMGGDNFWLIYNAATGQLRGLESTGASSEQAIPEFYRTRGYDCVPSRGYLAANTVPGAVAGWQAAYTEAQGMGGAIAWKDLLRPAFEYAEEGFPLSVNQVQWLQDHLNASDPEFADLRRFDGFRKIFFKPDGAVYQPGEVWTQLDLAQTLERIANDGANEFYQGKTAERIVADIQVHGGLLTQDDFAQHRARWVEPISVDYRDCRAYNLPPPTQGMASLQILSLLNQFDVRALGEGTADYYHLIVEAIKLAFRDRDRWVTDPDFLDIPLQKLLSKPYIRRQAGQIDLHQAQGQSAPALDSDTAWLGIVDRFGNAVSMIQSIADGFGSGIVAEGTGVLLQNRGKFFSLVPSHCNRLEPRKRTYHTLNPAMLLHQGKPYLVYGTMGGEGQPQTQAALVTRIVDFGMPVQRAIAAPRWIQGRNMGSQSDALKLEGRISQTVMDELRSRGHQVEVQPDFTDIMGHSGAILIDPDSQVRSGGADPRGDGLAMGY